MAQHADRRPTDHLTVDPPSTDVDFTDVIEALVAPFPAPTTAHPAARMHLRPVDPADHALPAHHDTVVVDLILMDDFAGELRRWLSSTGR